MAAAMRELVRESGGGEYIDRIVQIAEGNPGAGTALSALVQEVDDADELLDTLEAHDIHGPYVWVGFKDHCGGEVADFAHCIRTEDNAMLEEIQEYRDLRES